MNPKLPLCLALVLSGELAAFSSSAADMNSLRVVVIPSKSDVRAGEHLNLALRVENPTTTNQYVRVWSCSWPQNWQISNPRTIRPDIVDICEFNPPITEKIPAGGSIRLDLEVIVSKPISLIEPGTRKLSFQMGFTPIDSKKTFWSDVVKINILPPDK
ncbi:MAG: hypothetical protein ACLPRE_04850 [Limisphaerales bacterium]